MKIENYIFPESSFLSLEKDFALIIHKILQNKRLCRLLYYTTNDALEKTLPDLTQSQIQQILEKNIKIVPKIYFNNEALVYMIISFDDFVPSENPEFRNNTITFDIICHYDQWQLKNFASRPFKIAGEIDSMINGQRLTGIGLIDFVSGKQTILNDEYAMISLKYLTSHGAEDIRYTQRPTEWDNIVQNFNEQYNK